MSPKSDSESSEVTGLDLHRKKMAAPKSLTQTYLSIVERLRRAIGGIVPPKEVEDIVQEAYVRACQAEQATSIRAPSSFLFKTVRNLALDHVKRSESRLSDSFEEENSAEAFYQHSFGMNPQDETVSHEEFSLFCDAVRLLPAQCRRAFVLKKVYGFTRKEIAEQMNISENTVQTQIARGLKASMRFMDRLEREGRGNKVFRLRTDQIKVSEDDT